MKTSILKTKVTCTQKDFLKEVYTDLGAHERKACEDIFSSIVNSGSTLLSNLAHEERTHTRYIDTTRKRNRERLASNKGAQERCSRWLGNSDFDANEYLLTNGVALISEETTIAVDKSDISKEFGGEGMEGMAMGYDGSRGVLSMGHDVIAAGIIPKGRGIAIPLRVHLMQGRKGAMEKTKEIIKDIFTKTEGRGQLALDRGYDSEEMIEFLHSHRYKAVIRINRTNRDIFADNLTIPESMDKVRGWHAYLTNSKLRKDVYIKYRIGYFMQNKTKTAEYIPIMVVSSCFDGKELFFYVIGRNLSELTHNELKRIAHGAAQAYFDRWSIETFFLRVKQDYKVEDARVRTFKRLKNLLSLCVLAYYFTTRYLKDQKDTYDFILKAIKDSFHKVASNTQTFIISLRELLRSDRFIYISGRPRKKEYISENQLMFDF